MQPATRLKVVVLGLMGTWVIGWLWYSAAEHVERDKAATAARAATPPPVAWKTDTAGWALPMPASDAYAGIAARRVSFTRESDGALLALEDVVIERRTTADALSRSYLEFSLANTYITGGSRRSAPQTRFGNLWTMKAEQMDLLQALPPGDVLRLDRVTARFAGGRAKCLEEPCYAYLTLSDWGAGGQRAAHSGAHPLNYRPGAPFVAAER